jgi:hypothetical protein
MRLSSLVSLPIFVLGGFFATFAHSTTYYIQSYSVGAGATNTAHSTTYYIQGSVGEQANGTATDGTNTDNNGSINTEQLNVPGAPTLSNGSSTYYNQLNFIIATSGNPTDTTYAVAVSTNNFTSTLGYVQASGAISGTQFYQSYTAWGGGSGSFVTGLTPSTTYELRVAAMQGMFTNSNFGAYATASTVADTTTFSVSPNTLNLGSLLPGTVVTSSNLTLDFATTAAQGGNVYVYGANAGLYSANKTYTIFSASTNLTAATSGFGIQVSSASQSYGGPLTIVSPFNGSSHNVGAESTGPADLLSTAAATLSGTATANIQAKSSVTTPTANDYTETLTFVGAGSY